jgi:hypothetical protein
MCNTTAHNVLVGMVGTVSFWDVTVPFDTSVTGRQLCSKRNITKFMTGSYS